MHLPRTRFAFLLGIAVLTAASSARAAADGPSFDCHTAKTPVEKAICADPELSRLDAEMAERFNAASAAMTGGDRVALLEEQHSWLKSRAALCVANDPHLVGSTCLRRLYVDRIEQLTQEKVSSAATARHRHFASFSHTLSSGGSIDFNQLHVECRRDRADITVNNEDFYIHASGRGALFAAYVDCHLADGTSIRIKAGYKYPPVAHGQCGGNPKKQLTIWVDKRKVISRLDYTYDCAEVRVRSIAATAKEISCALPESAAHDSREEFLRRRGESECGIFAVDTGVAPDDTEFPSNPQDQIAVDELTVDPASRLPALCARLIDPAHRSQTILPADLKRPIWSEIDRNTKAPDLRKVDFDATSFVSRGVTEMADFDLENDGHITRVYRHQEYTHGFDGSAFARDRPGILTTPFDAHDQERSAKEGIYTFTYRHGTVFFHKGKTLILLRPANPVRRPAVVMVHSGKMDEVCTFKRQPENF